jgi:hypothetical protein
MMYSKQFLEALATENKDEAHNAFQASLNDKITDALEVRKVEMASALISNPDIVEEEVQLDEVLGKSAKAQDWIHDFVKSDNPKFEGKSKKERIKMALGAYYAKQRNEEFVDEGLKADMADARKGMKPFHPKADDVEKMQKVQTRVAKVAKRLGKKEADLWKEETIAEGGPTRKHFQQVADLLKNIPDEAKRKELAQHHAGLFKSQNPRFDHKRFFAAAGVNEETELDETAMQGGAVTNGQLNRNVLTNLRKAAQTLGLKGVNPVQAAAAHRDFGKLVAKNPKAPGYMLMRKLAANKAAQVQQLTQAGVPMGGALEAHPNEFNQALQRIKRFK